MIKKTLLGIGVGSLIACSAAPTTEDLGSTASSIIKGTNSDASQNAVVLILIDDGTSGNVAFCSGTLLTPQLVLTARHCVSKTDESAACDEAGNSLGGGVVYSDNAPSSMFIFVGANIPDFSNPNLKADGNAAKIKTDGSKTLCNHDVGLIELKAPIPNAVIMPIRLDSEPAKGDKITSIGWGVTDKAQQPAVRQQRSGVTIVDVGPANTMDGAVAPNEFQVGESICEGDSGGPAVASTGATVGVVSRGGNGTDPSSNPAASCEGAATFNLYTKTAPFKDLIVAAATELGQTVWIEGQPDPRLAANGTTCGVDTDCQSAHCLSSICAQDCTTTACASGFTCNAQKLCAKAALSHASTTTTTGCSAAPGNSDAGLFAGIFAGALIIAARRKKRVSPAR